VRSAYLQHELGFAGKASPALWPLRWGEMVREGTIERPALTLALASVPISIAAAESFLALVLVSRLLRCLYGADRVVLPRVFWLWLAWAGTEVLAWLFSPELRGGWGELRRLLLTGGLFLVLPALRGVGARLVAWQAVFLSSALGSLFLIGDFVARLIYYRREISVGKDISLYLRTGGLLNNWMVYGTVEILVAAGLVSFWFAYPEARRRWWPVIALNGVAVVLSLTRTVWVAVFVLLALQLWWKRSRWLWLLPALPLLIYALSPSVVRSRLNVSMHLDYYSNAERFQMLRVGWQMIRSSPWVGVGPGRIDKLYRSYLAPSDPVPAYHGHLHNNLVQMAAQFGVPVALAALLFTGLLLRDLIRAAREAKTREDQFSCQAGLLSLAGFLVAGCFDYTYGHSLALILLAFAALSPLPAGSWSRSSSEGGKPLVAPLQAH